MASDAPHAFSEQSEKRQKVDEGEKKKHELYESDEDDGEKKKLELDGSSDDDESHGLDFQKIFFGEPDSDDLNWMKMQMAKVHESVEEVTQKVEYSDSEDEELIDELLGQYSDQVKASEGFEVDEFPYLSSSSAVGLITPVSLLSTNTSLLEVLNKLSDLAITRYNKDHGTSYKFVKVLQANAKVVRGIIYFITFEANTAVDDQPMIFQAEVLAGIEEDEVYLCRPKSPTSSTFPSTSSRCCYEI